MSRKKGVTAYELLQQPEPSHEERYNAASAVAGQARSAFLIAALDLESSGNDFDILATDLQNEIDHLTGLRDQAISDAHHARKAAMNLKALVEPADQLTLF